eukprot:gene8863-18361_t
MNQVLQFFEDIGIPVCEGYGLTETSPIIALSVNNWNDRRLGCVGVVLPSLTVKLVDPATDEDLPLDATGEVCVSGPSVMSGYRNNPQANEEAFTFRDGKRFFRTGDLGTFIEGRFLKITGRIKEQFKLENGKYVVPGPLEDGLCRSRFISQAFMVGSNKTHTVALIVPDFVELKEWAVKQNLQGIDFKDADSDKINRSLSQHDMVIKLINDELTHLAGLMKGFERPENQMLTPKMSMRRNNIMKAYQQLIDDIYDNKAGFKTHVTPTESKTLI